MASGKTECIVAVEDKPRESGFCALWPPGAVSLPRQAFSGDEIFFNRTEASHQKVWAVSLDGEPGRSPKPRQTTGPASSSHEAEDQHPGSLLTVNVGNGGRMTDTLEARSRNPTSFIQFHRYDDTKHTKQLPTLGEEKGQRDFNFPRTWCYGLLYIACREERSSRTFEEFAEYLQAEYGSSEKKPKISTLAKSIKDKVNKDLLRVEKLGDQVVEAKNSAIRPEEMIGRFIAGLQVDPKLSQVALAFLAALKKCLKLKDAQEASILAAILFILLRLRGVPVQFSDVANVARVPESSVVALYKSMRPFVLQCLPESFRSKMLKTVQELPPV